MKKQHIVLMVIMVCVLSACASRKRGKGCDCPTFGQAQTAPTELAQKG